jgi:hypothetical protein
MGRVCNFSELIGSFEINSDELNQIVSLMAKAIELVQARLFQPWLKIPFIYRLLGFKKMENNFFSNTTEIGQEVSFAGYNMYRTDL